MLIFVLTTIGHDKLVFTRDSPLWLQNPSYSVFNFLYDFFICSFADRRTEATSAGRKWLLVPPHVWQLQPLRCDDCGSRGSGFCLCQVMRDARDRDLRSRFRGCGIDDVGAGKWDCCVMRTVRRLLGGCLEQGVGVVSFICFGRASLRCKDRWISCSPLVRLMMTVMNDTGVARDAFSWQRRKLRPVLCRGDQLLLNGWCDCAGSWGKGAVRCIIVQRDLFVVLVEWECDAKEDVCCRYVPYRCRWLD